MLVYCAVTASTIPLGLANGRGLPSNAFSDFQRFAASVPSGKNLEARGDRNGAVEKYWSVARFGQFIDSQTHTDSGPLGFEAASRSLQ